LAYAWRPAGGWAKVAEKNLNGVYIPLRVSTPNSRVDELLPLTPEQIRAIKQTLPEKAKW
jgi:hypothetical protein